MTYDAVDDKSIITNAQNVVTFHVKCLQMRKIYKSINLSNYIKKNIHIYIKIFL